MPVSPSSINASPEQMILSILDLEAAGSARLAEGRRGINHISFACPFICI